MRLALHAEWTKLRTMAGNAWLVAATVALTIGLSAAVSAAVECTSAGCDADPTKTALTGVVLGQAIVAILGALMISGEYGSGMIGVTFAAMPRRTTVMAAKGLVLGGVVLASGIVAVLGSLLAGRLIMPGNGFTAGHGHPAPSLADGATVRAVIGTILYLVLIALLSLGIATIVRDAAVAIGAVLGVLFLFPVLIQVVEDPDWYRHLQQISPLIAGLAVQNTMHFADAPIGPWAGLGVVAVWTVAALLAGGLTLRRRDA
jgi:ABC-2 type transport system permease protein